MAYLEICFPRLSVAHLAETQDCLGRQMEVQILEVHFPASPKTPENLDECTYSGLDRHVQQIVKWISESERERRPAADGPRG